MSFCLFSTNSKLNNSNVRCSCYGLVLSFIKYLLELLENEHFIKQFLVKSLSNIYNMFDFFK